MIFYLLKYYKTGIRLTILIFCLSTLSGCGLVSIKGSFRGLTSYYHISKRECPELFCASGLDLDSDKDSCVIKLANGKVVKDYISNFGSTVVYIWSPDCHGSNCPNINVLRQKCVEKNIKLVIVMKEFDCKIINIYFDRQHPVIAVDTRYYKTDFTSRYLRKFLYDLTGKKIPDMDGRFFFFDHGKFMAEADHIDS